SGGARARVLLITPRQILGGPRRHFREGARVNKRKFRWCKRLQKVLDKPSREGVKSLNGAGLYNVYMTPFQEGVMVANRGVHEFVCRIFGLFLLALISGAPAAWAQPGSQGTVNVLVLDSSNA